MIGHIFAGIGCAVTAIAVIGGLLSALGVVKLNFVLGRENCPHCKRPLS